jgi:hypothetical protein
MAFLRPVLAPPVLVRPVLVRPVLPVPVLPVQVLPVREPASLVLLPPWRSRPGAARQ